MAVRWKRIIFGEGGRFSTRLLIILLSAVFTTASLFVYRVHNSEDAAMRTDFLSASQMLSRAINVGRVVNLSGSSSDVHLPDYQRLKEQLLLVQRSNSKCRFLYLLGLKEPDIFFFVDSEPAESKDCSPPGQVYTEAPDAMRRAFNGVESVTGPYTDRWGTWITSAIPIRHPETKKIIAVFCMDVDAHDWAKSIHGKGIPALFTALFISTILIFFFILLRRSESAMKRIAASDAAIRQSEERFRTMAEQLIDVIFQTDGNGTVTYLSPAALHVFGWKPEEMVGRHFSEFVYEDDISEAIQLFQNVIVSGQPTHNIELRMKKKDGGFFHGELNGTQIITRANVKGRLGLLRDVTYRKQTEESLRIALERAQKQQEAVIEIAVSPALISGDIPSLAVQVTEVTARITGVGRAGLWLFNEEGNELRCIDLFEASIRQHSSGAVLRRHEYENEFQALQTAKYVDAHDPLTDPRTVGYVENYLKPMRITSMLDAVIRTRGKTLGLLCLEHVDQPHHWEPDEIAFACQLSDQIAIAVLHFESKQAEDALRESEEHYRRIVNTAAEGIWSIDANSQTTFVNARMAEMLGYTVEEIIGSKITDFMHSADTDDHQKKIELHKTGQTGHYERCFRRADGSDLWTIVSGTPLRDSNGDFCGSFGMLTDITEHKRLEEQLRQAQKMEAVGQLAGGVAHDFNNLLQVILGYIDIIQDDLRHSPNAQEALDAVRQAAERAADLTQQLLAFSRRQIILPANLDLNDLVQSVLKMIRRVIGEHIHLYFMPEDTLGTVFADKGQIEQALMNLCVNARDAMPTGGTLTIETENAVIDDIYCQAHPWATAGHYVRLSVTDSGCGMDESTRSQIFEPFFTTKEVGQGTGLGLATVYGIVKQHNGLIHVYSELGKGTVFKIYLPIVEHSPETVRETGKFITAGGTETILVAEDEEAVRRLVCHVLESAGYTVLTACDGEEALRIFEEHAHDIDLALLDVMMPQRSGREVMECIQATHPKMRFLFSSGYSENVIHTNFVINEGLRLISKPYHRADLLHAVRAALDGTY
ncbi:MAG TPA: PAS domain S-box protein [Candidatus Hydrogenedentes bacterium]|nr:PAS domain S-box protein [Candidatus Hydrogenedentota bacterium]